MGRLSKNLAVVLLVVSAASFLQNDAYAAASASMYLSPASLAVAKDAIFTVDIHEDSGSEPVNAVQAKLSYPTDKLQVVSIIPSSVFNVVWLNSYGNGSIDTIRGANPAVSGDQVIASINFKVLGDTGRASVNFVAGSSIYSANSNSNIMASSSGGNYALTAVSDSSNSKSPVPAPRDKIRPKISAIQVISVSYTSAVISWQTSEPATTEVNYGINQGYGLTQGDHRFVTHHKITLNSAFLMPGGLYHFMVKSVDPAGNATSSSDKTFTTRGVALLVTVIDPKNNPVFGAKVSFDDKVGVSDQKGRTTLYNLTLGKHRGTITYKGQPTYVDTEIQAIDPSGKPQAATFKIKTRSNYFDTFLAATLLAIGAIWLAVSSHKVLRTRIKKQIGRMRHKIRRLLKTKG